MLLALAILSMLVSLVGATVFAHIMRARRLRRRAPVEMSAVLDCFGAVGPAKRHLAEEILGCLARHLDVNPGVLRPDDKLARDLSAGHPRIGLLDISVEMFLEELPSVLRRHGIPECPAIDAGQTSLGELVTLVVGELPEQKEGSNGDAGSLPTQPRREH